MASKVVRLIQDQNLNVHSDAGASVAGKGDAFKSTKKGGLGGRKPLGDLSNRGKPDFTKASKKPALTNVPEIIADASNKKGLSKASDKVQTRGSRKALSDVSNTVKPPLQKTSSAVAEESSCDFEKEGFLHDHKQCIKAMREATHMDQMDIFRMIHGPNPFKILSSPPKASQFTKVEEESLTVYLEEIPEDQSTLLPIKQDSSVSSPPCNSPPLSPVRYTDSPWIWEECDFQVMGTP
ncbi:protein PATRONUS 2-like isoform X1 [Rosa rugosa]|uniref:protein PATRONUS 2-like isoform X1 n=1 Tax=Rosa rugosa TaxID=74645 RepID=UPI002B402C71|nr:protein PATRONUS 2-like isoform X1 [Rosa rugosa]